MTLHTETEEKLLPIVMLGSRDDYADKKNSEPAHTLIIRNVGFGPALRTVAQPFVAGTVDGKRLTIQLGHRTAIASADAEDIDAGKNLTGKKGTDGKLLFEQISKPLGDPAIKRVTLIGTISELITTSPAYVCISYQNARNEGYETWQKIYQPNNLAIDYLCQRKTQTPCTQTVEQACPKQ